MSEDFKSSRKLYWVAAFIMVVCLATTAFAAWYTIANQKKFDRQFQDIKKQLEIYNLPQADSTNITPDEAQYLLAVAKYCEVNDRCRGYIGLQGPIGTQGVQGVSGEQGPVGQSGAQGTQGEKGIDGLTGANGANGSDGREVERRCNPDRRRMEWKLAGDDQWQVEYNLAPGQSCAKE